MKGGIRNGSHEDDGRRVRKVVVDCVKSSWYGRNLGDSTKVQTMRIVSVRKDGFLSGGSRRGGSSETEPF